MKPAELANWEMCFDPYRTAEKSPSDTIVHFSSGRNWLFDRLGYGLGDRFRRRFRFARHATAVG